MQKNTRIRISLFMVLISIGLPAGAKPPVNFGFGPPPSFPDMVVHLLERAPTEDEIAAIRLTVPQAACLDRGFKRDVCGYVVCATLPGKLDGEYWVTVGHGVWKQGKTARCPASVAGEEYWKGDPPVQVRNFCNEYPKFIGCANRVGEGYRPLSVEESMHTTFSERLEVDRERRTAEEAARQQRQREARAAHERRETEVLEEKLKLMSEARAVKRHIAITSGTPLGPVAVYTSLVRVVYSDCRNYADDVFDPDVQPEVVDVMGLELCSKEAQAALNEYVRPAILKSQNAALSDLVKDLHAYAISSLRSLDNYRQSIIEARQDRNARMAGIDERVARIELELL